MKIKKINNTYLIRLEKDEKIIESIKQICKDKDIKSGYLSAIGAISSATLALYLLDKKEYFTKDFSEPMEIVSLSANISRLNNEPLIHCHTVISKQDMTAIGGHLNEAIVSATCEIILTPWSSQITRSFNEEIGLNLLDI